MTLIANGLLIAASLTACFYCWMLGRRLATLQEARQGLGSAVDALSGKVDAVRTASRDAQASVEGASAQLAAQLAEAKAHIRQLTEAQAQMREARTIAVKSAQAARVLARRTVEAEVAAQTLTKRTRSAVEAGGAVARTVHCSAELKQASAVLRGLRTAPERRREAG